MNWRVEVLNEENVLQGRAGKKQSSLPHIMVVGHSRPDLAQGPSSTSPAGVGVRWGSVGRMTCPTGKGRRAG